METLKKLDLKNISIPKLLGFILLGLVVFMVAMWLIGFALRIAFQGGGYDDRGYGYAEPAMYYESGHATADFAEEAYSQKLSIRNTSIAPLPPRPGGDGGTGTDAEEFEITSYHGSIETGNAKRECGEIEALKSLDHVIFENANRYERGCNYTFKVENERVDEVLAIIEGLKPEELNQNTHTIKNVVSDYTSEVEILQKKLSSIEETLTDAQIAYDQVETLAAQTRDVESLAKVIDSKIGLIERLTQERINIKERIDRLEREKAEQLDRLNFTFFNLHVYESKIVDLEAMKDSWVAEVRYMIQEFNWMLQNLTTGLLAFVFRAIPFAVFLIAALFILKYGWRGARYIWKK